LGGIFINVVPSEPGIRQFRLLTRNYQRVLVSVGGKNVLDSANERGEVKEGISHYTFQAGLSAGENRLNIALLRLGRMAQIGFRLECDSVLEARAPLPGGMSLETRQKVEEEFGSIRFERDIFYPEHAVGFHLGSAAASSAASAPHLEVELFDKYHHRLAQVKPTQPGMVELCQAKELDDRPFTIVCTWKTPEAAPDRQQLHHPQDHPSRGATGIRQIAERSRLMLQQYCDNIEHDAHSVGRK
jgi:hypothetical protein